MEAFSAAEGAGCEAVVFLGYFEDCHDAVVVISQPFWPAYLTAERIAKAKKLKLALTAGIGSDHIDLEAAARRHITVAEVTGSNSVSVAEHVVMMVLLLARLPTNTLSKVAGISLIA
jgi:formate dehydrogenase